MAFEQLAKALSEFQAEMRPIVAGRENPFYKSRYADLADLWAAVREPLAKHGLAVSQFPTNNAEGVGVITYLMHSSGENIAHEFTLKPVKADPQGVGSVITYARRYALSGVLGLATDDDDDANGQVTYTAAEWQKTELRKIFTAKKMDVNAMREFSTAHLGKLWLDVLKSAEVYHVNN